MRILKEDGEEAKTIELGRVVCKLPLPPGTMSTLYKGNERFIETYFQKFPGFYDTCDAGIKGGKISNAIFSIITIKIHCFRSFIWRWDTNENTF